MKVKVVVSDGVLNEINLGNLIKSGQVLEVTGSGVSELPNGMIYKYYEFSSDVLGVIPTDGFRISEGMVEVL